MSKRDDAEKTGHGNKPVETLRDGALKVAIFRNESEHGENYSMAPGRIYTDKATGAVRETTSLNGGEALRMAHLLTKSHDRITELREKRKERTPERGEGQRSKRGGHDEYFNRENGFDRER